jgi:membrane-bound lytic murein transglycosylase B
VKNIKSITILTLALVLFASFVSNSDAAEPTQKKRTYKENPIPFKDWVATLRAEAMEQGISESTFDTAFATIVIHPRVIELDRKQPEFTLTFEKYIAGRVTPGRISRGQDRIREHFDTIKAVEQKYSVQSRFIAAIWGMETNFGGYIGGMDVIRSLTTLAYDPRRATYFRKQLLLALKILEEGHIDYANMKGSWAGAMGQGQFMPSSFYAFAQDFDGDGKRDIWKNEGDALASIANYLGKNGWNQAQTWGRQVTLPAGFDAANGESLKRTSKRGCRAMRQHTKSISLRKWNDLGIRRLNGDDLPDVAVNASLVRPAGPAGPAFLTYGNYQAILSYNCSNYYAIAVGQLADELLYAAKGN